MGDGGNCGGMAAKNVGDGDGYKRMEESCRGGRWRVACGSGHGRIKGEVQREIRGKGVAPKRKNKENF